MRTKMMKKTFAVALSATMVMGMSVTAFATDPSTSVEAPIFSFDVENVIVPTTFATAFNPNELDVKIDNTNTSNAQVLSKNYGILNKSSKDKIVTVSLNVTDKNTDKITFVNSAADVTSAKKDTYTVYLKAVPAGSGEVKVAGASADKDTAATALGDVTMTAATGNDVTLKSGENLMAFKLDKATYTPKSGNEVTLGGSTENNVADNYEITGVAASGKGITAFKFDGALNQNTDWTKLPNGIEIEAIYTFENADSEAVISGTGAMVQVDKAPIFSTGNIAVINVDAGAGSKAFASLEKITGPWQGSEFDLTPYATVADDNSTITIEQEILGGWASAGIDPTVTIKYKNANNEDVTATVELKTH